MMNYIDVEKIQKFCGISQNDVLEMPLKKVFHLMEDIKKKTKLEEIKDDLEKFPLEVKINYFLQYDLFKTLFGEKNTNDVLSKTPFHKLATEEWYQQKTDYITSKNYILKGEGFHSFEILHKRASRYSKTESRKGYCYYVPSRYQGLEHEKMIRSILEKIMPKIMNDYKFNIYEIYDGRTAEIYLETGTKNQSLYVPIEALLKKDVNAIEKRNKEIYKENYETIKDNEIVQKFYDSLKSEE